MPDLVRVRDKSNNTEFTVGRQRAEQLVERGGVEILNTAATDHLGRALPASEAINATTKNSKEQAR